jgi:hypothetical protein
MRDNRDVNSQKRVRNNFPETIREYLLAPTFTSGGAPVATGAMVAPPAHRFAVGWRGDQIYF